MKVLIDTHVLLWFVSDPKKIGRSELQLLQSVNNRVFVSAATAWEIAIKVSLGKLILPSSPAHFVSTIIKKNSFTELPVNVVHTETLMSLPDHHSDPFDRILIAQSLTEGFKFMSADKTLKKYAVDFIWVK